MNALQMSHLIANMKYLIIEIKFLIAEIKQKIKHNDFLIVREE